MRDVFDETCRCGTVSGRLTDYRIDEQRAYNILNKLKMQRIGTAHCKRTVQ